MCHIYPAMMKLDTVVRYLKKIIYIYIYESRDAPLSFAHISIFHRKSANFAISKNTNIDHTLVYNF